MLIERMHFALEGKPRPVASKDKGVALVCVVCDATGKRRRAVGRGRGVGYGRERAKG